MAWSTVSQVSTPKPIGTPCSQAHAIEPGGTLAADEVEMGRLAADHGAQRGDAVVAAQLGETLGGQRQLEGAGHADDMDVRLGGAMPLQRIHGAVDEICGRSDR